MRRDGRRHAVRARLTGVTSERLKSRNDATAASQPHGPRIQYTEGSDCMARGVMGSSVEGRCWKTLHTVQYR